FVSGLLRSQTAAWEVRLVAAKCRPSGLSQARSRGASCQRIVGGPKVKTFESLWTGHRHNPPVPVVNRLPAGQTETHRQNPAGSVATLVNLDQSQISNPFPVETTSS